MSGRDPTRTLRLYGPEQTWRAPRLLNSAQRRGSLFGGFDAAQICTMCRGIRIGRAGFAGKVETIVYRASEHSTLMTLPGPCCGIGTLYPRVASPSGHQMSHNMPGYGGAEGLPELLHCEISRGLYASPLKPVGKSTTGHSVHNVVAEGPNIETNRRSVPIQYRNAAGHLFTKYVAIKDQIDPVVIT